MCVSYVFAFISSAYMYMYVLILTRPDRKNRRVRPSGICQRSASSFSFKEGKNVICINCRQHTNAVHMPSTCSPHTLSLVYSTHCSCYSPHLNSGSTFTPPQSPSFCFAYKRVARTCRTSLLLGDSQVTSAF